MNKAISVKLKAKREKIIKLCRAKSQPVVCAVAACTENSEREKRWFVAAHVANLPGSGGYQNA